MEYAVNAKAGQLRDAPSERRPLDRISDGADRVDVLISRIAGILARVRNQPEPTTSGAVPVSISYLDNIDRLHSNLDILDKVSSELAELA